jgi:SAM-dependent methyltransferase
VPRSLAWRVRSHLRWRASIWFPSRVAPRLPRALRERLTTAEPYTAEGQWLRAVMIPDTRRAFESMNPSSLDVVEVSGALWTDMPWASRMQLDFPEFDLCEPPAELPGPFDLVICEQVLEHVPNPLKAVDTLRRLCKPDGHVYVSTPFLVRLHEWPGDYWRFTPDGMALLLRSQGLEPLWVRSWGNRSAIVANFDRWVPRLPWQSLADEPHLPASVWALAQPARTSEAAGNRDEPG